MKNISLLLLMAGTVASAQVKKGKLLWEENFSGKTLNEKVWNYELGDGCPNVCGWGNNERQVYTTDNHKLEGGNLIITAKKDGDKYTSTRITTAGKREFHYGYMEARAKLPVGQGIWPAFWMLGSNIKKVGWPLSGEIDILEYIGREPHTAYTTLHTKANHGDNASSKKTPIADIEKGFHTYGCNWTPEYIEFFIDDKSVYKFQPEHISVYDAKPDDKSLEVWPFDQPFYFIVNVAVGGNFGGPEVDDSIFPQEYVIDYIRVYSNK